MKLPQHGSPRDRGSRTQMRERKTADADWEGGRTWSLVYPAGEAVDDDAARRERALHVRERPQPVPLPEPAHDGGRGLRDDRETCCTRPRASAAR